MSSSSRAGSAKPTVQPRSFKSSKQNEDNEYEFKAAYLVVIDDLQDEITSEDELFRALQQAGRNPSKRTTRKYWTRNTRSISFREFCEICRKEPVTSEDELMKAFKKIDANGDGYLSNTELRNVLTTRGEKMSSAEVAAIIEEVDENKDGKLDYREFCNMVLKTSEEAKQFNIKNMERKIKGGKGGQSKTRRKDHSPNMDEHSSAKPREIETNQSSNQHPKEEENDNESAESSSDDDIIIGRSSSALKSNAPVSTSSTVYKTGKFPKPQPRRSTSAGRGRSKDDISSSPSSAVKDISKLSISSKSLRLPKPKNIKEWQKVESRGCFYFEEDGRISSHQYDLEMSEDSSVWFSIEPISLKAGDLNSTRDSSNGPVDTMLFILREDKSLVTFTEQRDAKGKYGVRCDLEKGSYKLIPFTTGCRLKRRGAETGSETKLVKKSDDGYVLTSAFKEALGEIFDMCDLDGDGYLSRDEFNWFNIRTSGEEVNDEEWEVVEENVTLHKGKLTKDGFIELNQMEAEDNEGDAEDLWVTLSCMGFNKKLTIDEACAYSVEVYSEDANIELAISGIKQGGRSLETAIVESTINKGEASRVKQMRDLTLHTYSNDFRVCLVVENKSNNKVNLNLDCSKSKNCITNRKSLNFTVDVPPKSVMVGQHLMPKKESQDWSVKVTESVV